MSTCCIPPCLKACFVHPFNRASNLKDLIIFTLIPIISPILLIKGAKEAGDLEDRVSLLVRALVTLLTFGVLTLLLDIIVYVCAKIYRCCHNWERI